MSFFINRVRFFTTSTGTGDLTVGSAYNGTYFTPDEAGAVNGQPYTWVITRDNDVEITVANYSTAGGGTVERSSGTTLISRVGGVVGTSKINLPTGSSQVHIDAAAEDLLSVSTFRGANTVLAGPASGSPGVPVFRALVPADTPDVHGFVATAVFDIYRIDATSAAIPRTATISSVAGVTLTLSSSVAPQFFTSSMLNNSWVRIWNTSKTPAQPAWVSNAPSATTLTVISAASVSGWVNGETIQIGDGTSGTPESTTINKVAIDISPLLTTVFGTAFPVAGVVLSALMVSGATAGDSLSYTPSGAAGSVVGIGATTQVTGVASSLTASPVGCSALSPVSNSNLLYISESIASTAAIRLVRVSGIFT